MIERQRQKLVNALQELFNSHPGIKHLEFNPLFFINARDTQDAEIQILQKRLMKRACEHPRWGEEMPTAWIPLEWQLAKEVEKGNNIISRKELNELNSRNQTMVLTESQIETFLKVQHSLGKLLYFATVNLRNFVIINPAYLVEVLRSIVTEKQFWPTGPRFREILHKLQKIGIMTRQDIYWLWNQEEFKQILSNKEYFIDMLGHLDILISPCSDDNFAALPTSVDEFIVPCMINRPNNTKYLAKFCTAENAIILAYTFIEEVIPPAMVYRFIGSFIHMYEIKNYKGRRMLFSDLAVVQVNDAHDIVVQVQTNRLVVFLVHSRRKMDIEPTLASSIQECLSAATSRIAEFYSILANDRYNSPSKEPSAPDEKYHDTRPFSIEYGVFCTKSSICFFSHSTLLSSPQWICPCHKMTHNVQTLSLWFANKKAADQCQLTCQGLREIELRQCPADVHLRRLAEELDEDMCRHIYFELGMKANDWKDLQIQFQHGNSKDRFTVALVKWRDKDKNSTFEKLEDALRKSEIDKHKLCQVFRVTKPDISAYDGQDINKKPTVKSLVHFSNHVGNSTMHLALELGLHMCEIEDVQHKFPNMLKDQTKEILRLWSQRQNPKPTILVLIEAAYRIGKGNYLPDYFL